MTDQLDLVTLRVTPEEANLMGNALSYRSMTWDNEFPVSPTQKILKEKYISLRQKLWRQRELGDTMNTTTTSEESE